MYGQLGGRCFVTAGTRCHPSFLGAARGFRGDGLSMWSAARVTDRSLNVAHGFDPLPSANGAQYQELRSGEAVLVQ